MAAVEVLGLCVALSPGVGGLLFGAAGAAFYSRNNPGISVMLAGAGGVLGYMMLALFIRLRDSAGAPVFVDELIHTISLLTLVSALASMWAWFSRSRFAPFGGWCPESKPLSLTTSITVTVALFFLVTLTFYQVAVNPVSSWDGLTSWTRLANLMLQFDLNPDFVGNAGIQAEHGAYPYWYGRHPVAIHHISAFSGFALKNTEKIRGWLVPWSFCWICGAIVVWGAIKELSDSSLAALLGSYAYISLPLLEHHSVLVGYADLWVAVCVTIAAAFLGLALATSRRTLWVIGMVFSLLPLGLKNTGIIYTAVVLIPYSTVFIWRQSSRLAISLLAVAVLFAAWGYVKGFDVALAGERAALIRGEENQIIFGGYHMDFESYPLVDILRNNAWAFFKNQSFLLAGLLWLCGIGLAVDRISVLDSKEKRVLAYLLGTSAMLVLAFMLPQLVTRYAERYAAPDSDLGNSRFLLAVGPIIILLLGLFNRRAAPNAKTSRR